MYPVVVLVVLCVVTAIGTFGTFVVGRTSEEAHAASSDGLLQREKECLELCSGIGRLFFLSPIPALPGS
jgi:hypothetical protein